MDEFLRAVLSTIPLAPAKDFDGWLLNAEGEERC